MFPVVAERGAPLVIRAFNGDPMLFGGCSLPDLRFFWSDALGDSWHLTEVLVCAGQACFQPKVRIRF